MLAKRLASAIIAMPILGVAVWFGHPWFTIVVAVAAAGAAREFFNLSEATRGKPLAFVGIAGVVYLVVESQGRSPFSTTSLVAAAIIAFLVAIMFSRIEHAAAGWAWTVAGFLYLGWLLRYPLFLRDLDHGRYWVFLALLATFATDSAAYLVGSKWGRHRMAPQISPQKTWEGAIGGFAGGLAATFVLIPLFDLPLSWPHTALLGALIPIFAEMGDLAESALKRGAGVKEAGVFLPGHGGFLDRMDSLLLVVVMVYYYATYILTGTAP